MRAGSKNTDDSTDESIHESTVDPINPAARLKGGGPGLLAGIKENMRRVMLAPEALRNYIRESAQLTHGRFFRVFSANLIFALLVIGAHVVLMFQVLGSRPRGEQNIMLGYLTLPVTTFALSGILRFYLDLVRGQAAHISLVFQGWKSYLNLFLLLVVYYSLYVLLFKIVFTIGDYKTIIQIRIVLGLLFFIWLFARLLFAPLFVVDGGFGAKEAIKRSFFLTSGRTIKTLVLISTYLLVLFGGLLGFVLGILYTFALVVNAYVMTYDIYLGNEYSRHKRISPGERREEMKSSDEQSTGKRARHEDNAPAKKARVPGKKRNPPESS